MGDPVPLVVSHIVKTVIGKATTLINQKFQLLKGVEKDVKTLSSRLTSIQSVLKDAEGKQLESEQLRDWLGKLKEATYDAEDVLETLTTEASLWKRKHKKLEISGCQQVNTLPEISQYLEQLVLDDCHGETLVRSIPNTDSLFSLVISNISSLNILPKLPHLSGLKALYIHCCSDLVSLAGEESSLQGILSLKLLSIQNCPRLVTLPEQGLPIAIECLSIGSCHNLKSLGPKEVLRNLTCLKDLYLSDCPVLHSLPEEGLPASLQHLHIEGCPLLLKKCRNDRDPDWPKIMNTPDLELEPIDGEGAS